MRLTFYFRNDLSTLKLLNYNSQLTMEVQNNNKYKIKLFKFHINNK